MGKKLLAHVANFLVHPTEQRQTHVKINLYIPAANVPLYLYQIHE
jgi:hypothetical protein